MAYINGHHGIYIPGEGVITTDDNGFAWRVPLTSAQQAEWAAEQTNDPADRGYAGKTAAQIALLANNSYPIDNPTPPINLPAPINPSALWASFSKASLVNLAARPAFNLLVAAIAAQDFVTLDIGMQFALEIGDVAATEVTAAAVVLSATIPDPSWQAQVPAVARARVVLTGAVDNQGNPAWLDLEATDVTTATGVN
jgi:hypothetical protein